MNKIRFIWGICEAGMDIRYALDKCLLTYNDEEYKKKMSNYKELFFNISTDNRLMGQLMNYDNEQLVCVSSPAPLDEPYFTEERLTDYKDDIVRKYPDLDVLSPYLIITSVTRKLLVPEKIRRILGLAKITIRSTFKRLNNYHWHMQYTSGCVICGVCASLEKAQRMCMTRSGLVLIDEDHNY